MELSVYADDMNGTGTRAPAVALAQPSAGLVPPAGGWAIVPAVDDLVALAASLNAPGELVFIDYTV